jgi:hypothetical protein
MMYEGVRRKEEGGREGEKDGRRRRERDSKGERKERREIEMYWEGEDVCLSQKTRLVNLQRRIDQFLILSLLVWGNRNCFIK